MRLTAVDVVPYIKPDWIVQLPRGMRYCHGELVHWRKEKRRVRKLALLNAKQKRLMTAARNLYVGSMLVNAL